jgi:hypothetical protein
VVSADVTVADEPQASRYVIHADGRQIGLLSYRLTDTEMAMLHAEVHPTRERRGLGSQLVGFALDDARRRGLAVRPYCPFVRQYISEHPEYTDLVPADSRSRFGL